MDTILSYKNRGKWGKASYRGNCSGHVIKDLLEFYQPKKFLEVFSGSGTGKEVATELGMANSIHLDLNNGWNALTDEIPSGNDFTFSHPPYWDIIAYETERGAPHKDDLSNPMSYGEFISKLDRVNQKIYQALTRPPCPPDWGCQEKGNLLQPHQRFNLFRGRGGPYDKSPAQYLEREEEV